MLEKQKESIEEKREFDKKIQDVRKEEETILQEKKNVKQYLFLEFKN